MDNEGIYSTEDQNPNSDSEDFYKCEHKKNPLDKTHLKSELHYEMLFERTSQGIIYQDAEGKIISANPAAQKILWLSAEQLSGKTAFVPVWKAIQTDGSHFPLQNYPSNFALLTGQCISDIIIGIFNSTGDEVRWVNISAEPLFHPGQSTPYMVYTTFDDITESRKQLATATEKNNELERINALLNKEIISRKKIEARLRTILDNIPTGIWHADEEGNIIFGNSAAQQIWQGARYVGIEDYREYKGWWLDSGKPIEPEQWAVSRAVKSGETSINERIRIQCFDGSYKTILNSAVPIFNNEEKILGAIIVNQDISDIYNKEKELAYQSILLENISDAVIAFDIQNKITNWNKAAEKVYGWEAKEVIGKSVNTILRSEISEKWDIELHKTIMENGSANYEINHFTKFDKIITIEANTFCIRDIHGEIIRYITVNRDITQRKQAEEKLKRNEHLLRLFVEHTPAAIAMFDRNLNYIVASRNYLKDYGLGEEPLTGRSHYEIFPHLPERWKEIHKICLRGFVEKSEDDFYVHPNGKVDWLRWEIHPWYETNSEIGGILLFSEIITERKHAEAEMKAQKELLELIMESLPVGLWIYDKDGFIINGNKKAREIWRGVKYIGIEDYLEYKGWWYDTGKRIQAEEWASARAIRKGESAIREVVEIECFDGSHKVIFNSSVPIFDNKKIIGAVAVNEDITELKDLEKQLISSEERFRQLAGAMPQIVWTADSEGKLDYLNKHWSEFTGISEIEGLKWGWAQVIHPADEKKAFEAWEHATEKGVFFEIVSRFRQYDGEYRWQLGRSVPQMDEQGKIIKWIGTITDIHLQVQALEKLETTLRELERSNKELEQFAYVASHDLQEPLRMISSYTQLLARKYKNLLDDRADEYINFIVDGAKRMHFIISDLLKYARVSSKSNPPTRVDCNLLINEIIRDLHVIIMENKINIRVDNLPEIKSDPVQLRQVFQNLIGNAVKFHSATNPEVWITAESCNQEWVFCVRDNGIGIDPEQYDRIFLIFQRLHERDKYPGTGIGLAICKKIIEQQGGTIWVESEPGKGTAFYFTLPCAE